MPSSQFVVVSHVELTTNPPVQNPAAYELPESRPDYMDVFKLAIHGTGFGNCSCVA